jgi:phosphocarrier protein
MVVNRRGIEIVNALGLHLRAADRFARLARLYDSAVRVHHEGTSADGKSILELLSLAAGPGCRLDVEADGSDAEAMVTELTALVARGFLDGAQQPDAAAIVSRIGAS